MLHRFGRFELDTASFTLSESGVLVNLPRKAVELLSVLVGRSGEVVTKDQLMGALWPDGFVEEANLTQHVYLLRRAFRERGVPDPIQTVPRRGYRFDLPQEARRHAPARRPFAHVLRAAVAAAVALLLAGSSTALRAPQLSGEAQQAYALGRYFWNLRSVSGMTRSIAYFREVIALAPRSALGYAGLADAYTELADFEQPCNECGAWRRLAQQAAQRAVTVDPSSAAAHVAYGMTRRVFAGDERGAAREFRAALAIDPNDALANQWYGNMLIAQGSLDEGIRRLRTAASEQPVSTATYAWLARGYYYERRYSDAIRYAHRALALEPTRLETIVLLGLAQEARGHFAQALIQFKDASHAGASHADTAALYAGAYAAMGRRQAALTALRETRSNPADFYAARDTVVALALAGERKSARTKLARLRYRTKLDRELVLQDPHIRALLDS